MFHVFPLPRFVLIISGESKEETYQYEKEDEKTAKGEFVDEIFQFVGRLLCCFDARMNNIARCGNTVRITDVKDLIFMNFTSGTLLYVP